MCIKADNIYKDISEDIETRFEIENYELDRPLSKEKIKKVIPLMKDELGEKIMTRFVWLRVITYSYLIDESSEDKKVRGTKSGSKKENKNCLEATQVEYKINYLEKITLT